MPLRRRRQGMRDQLVDALVTAATRSQDGGAQEKKRRRLGGRGAVLAGAALYVAGRGVLGRGRGEEPEADGPPRRVRTRV